MLSGDDLSTQYFIATIALTFLGVGVTQAGWTQKLFIRSMFGLGGAFALTAALWGQISATFPKLRDLVSPVGSNPTAWFVLVLATVTIIFILDYRARTVASPPAHAGQIEIIKGRLDEVAAEAAKERSNIIKTMTSLAKATDEKIAVLEKNTIRNNQKILRYDRDLPVLTETVIEHLALSLLSCIQEPPQFTQTLSELSPELANKERKSAEDYSVEVNRILGSTQWGMSVRSIIGESEGTGEYKLRSIPNAERPSNIDPLDLRRYMIAKVRCEGLWTFVRSQRIEARDKYLAHLNFMKQRLDESRQMDAS